MCAAKDRELRGLLIERRRIRREHENANITSDHTNQPRHNTPVSSNVSNGHNTSTTHNNSTPALDRIDTAIRNRMMNTNRPPPPRRQRAPIPPITSHALRRRLWLAAREEVEQGSVREVEALRLPGNTNRTEVQYNLRGRKLEVTAFNKGMGPTSNAAAPPILVTHFRSFLDDVPDARTLLANAAGREDYEFKLREEDEAEENMEE